jgi:hypothetical protein
MGRPHTTGLETKEALLFCCFFFSRRLTKHEHTPQATETSGQTSGRAYSERQADTQAHTNRRPSRDTQAAAQQQEQTVTQAVTQAVNNMYKHKQQTPRNGHGEGKGRGSPPPVVSAVLMVEVATPLLRPGVGTQYPVPAWWIVLPDVRDVREHYSLRRLCRMWDFHMWVSENIDIGAPNNQPPMIPTATPLTRSTPY